MTIRVMVMTTRTMLTTTIGSVDSQPTALPGSWRDGSPRSVSHDERTRHEPLARIVEYLRGIREERGQG
mgnify:CR=1 FL=1